MAPPSFSRSREKEGGFPAHGNGGECVRSRTDRRQDPHCAEMGRSLEPIAQRLTQEEDVVGNAGYWAAPNRRPQRDLRYDRGGEARANLFGISSRANFRMVDTGG